MKRLKKYLNQGTKIRVWYSACPDSMYGFCFLCDFMKNYDNELMGVKLPEYMQRENGIALYSDWGEVEPEDMKQLQSMWKVISVEERRLYVLLWNELVLENAPLRAVVNGKLMSVD